MFKNVHYVGFNGPAQRALVERAMPILADEIQTWREEVEVEWDASGSAAWVAGTAPPTQNGIALELRLTLPNSTGIVRRSLTADVFEDDSRLRDACRSVWSKLLDKLLRQQDDRLKKYLHVGES